MPIGSKFAYLWTEDASQSPSSESSTEGNKEADDSLKVTMEFLRSMDQDSLDNLLGRDCDSSDLFASFGYDTTFGAVANSGLDLTSSPARGKNNSSVADRAFTSTSWQSENASGGSPSFRNVSDASILLGAHGNCSSFSSPNIGADLCRNFSPRKSEGDSLGGTGMGCHQLGASAHTQYYETKYGHGLDAPLLTSSPVSMSPIETESSVFSGGHVLPHSSLGNYSGLTQTLTYIASQLAELGLGLPQGESSPRSPWGNLGRFQGFGNLNPEMGNKWIRLLRSIQDTLMTATDMEPTHKNQMLELSFTLQKQLVNHMMGDETPKNSFNGVVPQDMSNESQLQAAKFLRENSGFLNQSPYLWRGVLPRRDYQNAIFSCKVFLGGLPYDMTEAGMIQAFKPFGNVKVEWPGKEISPLQHKGYAYIIFENEKQVKIMLQHCTIDYAQDGKWFCKMSSRRVRMKDVEVIPWALSDSNFALRPTSKLEPRLTIFVGALHGMLNAEGLAIVMEDVFGGVVHAGIDTDRNRYPIGSGRVSFDNFQSYFTAINAAFVEIKSSKFSKVVQVDPYLEDSNCSHCSLQQAPYFCRSLSCFRYYCRTCFELAHATEALRSHRPLMRNPNKKSQSNGFSSPTSFKVNYRI